MVYGIFLTVSIFNISLSPLRKSINRVSPKRLEPSLPLRLLFRPYTNVQKSFGSNKVVQDLSKLPDNQTGR